MIRLECLRFFPVFFRDIPLNIINLAPVDLRVIKHTWCILTSATAIPKHVAFVCVPTVTMTECESVQTEVNRVVMLVSSFSGFVLF